MKRRKNGAKSEIESGRNWLAIHAKGLTGRKGAGAHRSKKTYTRKTKHKGRKDGY